MDAVSTVESGRHEGHRTGDRGSRPCKKRKDGAPHISKWERAGRLKAWATRPAGVYPFLPGPKPEDFDLSDWGSDQAVDAAESATEHAANNAESAADAIKSANRIGPSRAARIASLESRASKLSNAGKVLNVLSYALAAREAAKNLKDCAK